MSHHPVPAAVELAAWPEKILADPETVAAIRRRIKGRTDPGQFRPAWRRVLRRMREQGAATIPHTTEALLCA